MAERGDAGQAVSVWDCGSPLYDSSELAAFQHLIDRHMVSFPSPLRSGASDDTRFHEPAAEELCTGPLQAAPASGCGRNYMGGSAVGQKRAYRKFKRLYRPFNTIMGLWKK